MERGSLERTGCLWVEERAERGCAMKVVVRCVANGCVDTPMQMA